MSQHRLIETLNDQAHAASTTPGNTCALLEQESIYLSPEYSKLKSQIVQPNTSIEQQISELAQAQSEKHQSNIKAICKGEIQRLSVEASELHKSEQKDLENSEQDATIYLDKIVNLTDDVALKQAHLHDKEVELACYNTACARLVQVTKLVDLYKGSSEEWSRKAGDLEGVIKALEIHSSQFEGDYKEKLEKELSAKKQSEQVTKLVDLYKGSSEEWSRKAGDLEGVIKALEIHWSQFEGDYKEKLEKELSAKKQSEQEAAVMKEKFEKCELEIEKNRKADVLSVLPISSFNGQSCETTLAVSLRRDGWPDGLNISPSYSVPTDQNFFLVILGSRGTGKSSFLGRHRGGGAAPVHAPSFLDWYRLYFQTNIGMVTFHCFDILDTRQLRSQEDYTRVDACVVLFAVDEHVSFSKVRSAFKNARRYFRPRIPIALCGNKVDIPGLTHDGSGVIGERWIQMDEIVTLMSIHLREEFRSGMTGYWEVSATSNYNVLEPLEWLLGRSCGRSVSIVRQPFLLADPTTSINIPHQKWRELYLLHLLVQALPLLLPVEQE